MTRSVIACDAGGALRGEPAAAASAPSLPTAADRPFGGTSDRKLIRLVQTETVGDLAHLIYGSAGE